MCFGYHLSYEINKKAHNHQHCYHTVYLSVVCPLDGFAVLKSVAVEYRVAEAIGVYRVVVDVYVAALYAVFE